MPTPTIGRQHKFLREHSPGELKDVHFEGNVWIPANSDKVLQNLNMTDKHIFETMGYLN